MNIIMLYYTLYTLHIFWVTIILAYFDNKVHKDNIKLYDISRSHNGYSITIHLVL